MAEAPTRPRVQNAPPTAAPAPAAGAAAAPTASDLAHHAWATLTSPRTLAGLGVTLAALLLAGLFVPQGATRDVLDAHFSFAVARTIEALELHHVLTAWPTLLTGLLIALNLTGLVLARRGASPAALPGPTAIAEGLLPEPPTDVAARLTALDPRLTARGLDPGPTGDLVARRGGPVQPLILVAFGLTAALAGHAVDLLTGLDARATFLAGAPTPDDAQLLGQIRDGDRWLDAQLPLQLVCQDADPADPWRRRACQVGGPSGVSTVDLWSGAQAQVEGVTLRPLSEAPAPADPQAPARLLLRRADAERPEALTAEPGGTYALPDGRRLTAFQGADGPLVVLRAPDQPPVLLAPAPDHATPPPVAGLHVSAVPSARVAVALTTHPGRLLLWTGLGLALLGLLAFAAVPQLTARLTPTAEGTRVTLTSWNRARRPRHLLERLVAGARKAAA